MKNFNHFYIPLHRELGSGDGKSPYFVFITQQYEGFGDT